MVVVMIVLAGVLALGGGSVSAAPEPKAAPAADSLSAPPRDGSPLAVLAAFERAWLVGASDSVLACMSSQSIELILHRAGPTGGSFPPSQAAYLIRDLLHYGSTVEFRVVSFEWKDDDPPRAEIEWVHRMSGYEVREELEVALAREGQVWRIVRLVSR